MIVYPAIDLRGGKVVRLQEGDPGRQTVFSEDPLVTARLWIEQGAEWLHVVNLDGAFAAANGNSTLLEQIAQLSIPVQFGGGIRSLDDVQRAFDQGAARVVLGTMAVEQPAIVEQAISKWGTEAICVALDARDGRVAVRGWQEITDLTPADFGRQMAERGLCHALFTDVGRDGGLSGVNIEATVELGQKTGLQVIASGGVSSLDDIVRLRHSQAVAGLVIGMALYKGTIRLADAIATAKED
jgi:phosphoribosylformimino-5-aminoimidazole carboxamide ribotide isomerase